MKLTLLAGFDCGKSGDCPAMHSTDRGTAYVKGDVVNDPEVLSALRPGRGEGVVEVPLSLLRAAAAQAFGEVSK